MNTPNPKNTMHHIKTVSNAFVGSVNESALKRREKKIIPNFHLFFDASNFTYAINFGKNDGKQWKCCSNDKCSNYSNRQAQPVRFG